MFICICDASRELIVIDSLPLSRQNTDEDEDAREVSGKLVARSCRVCFDVGGCGQRSNPHPGRLESYRNRITGVSARSVNVRKLAKQVPDRLQHCTAHHR